MVDAREERGTISEYESHRTAAEFVWLVAHSTAANG